MDFNFQKTQFSALVESCCRIDKLRKDFEFVYLLTNELIVKIRRSHQIHKSLHCSH